MNKHTRFNKFESHPYYQSLGCDRGIIHKGRIIGEFLGAGIFPGWRMKESGGHPSHVQKALAPFTAALPLPSLCVVALFQNPSPEERVFVKKPIQRELISTNISDKIEDTFLMIRLSRYLVPGSPRTPGKEAPSESRVGCTRLAGESHDLLCAPRYWFLMLKFLFEMGLLFNC